MTRTEKLQNISYVDLVTRLNRARNMDVRSLTTEEIDQRIGLIIDGYHTVVIKVEINGLYRARKNLGDRPWESVNDLWYPPASLVKTRGRFNEAGSPAFYTCNRSTGAIFEVRPCVGDMITLLTVRTKTPSAILECAHIGLERSLAPELGAVQRGKMPRQNPRFQAMLQHYGISNKWLAVDEFLSEMATTLFTQEQEQDKYRITNAISKLLFKIPNVQGLNYPSVATGLTSLNLCLKPDIADRYFIPSEAWMIKIEEGSDELPGLNNPAINKRGPFYRTSFVRKSEAIEADGRIRWSDELQNVRPSDIRHLAYHPRLPV